MVRVRISYRIRLKAFLAGTFSSLSNGKKMARRFRRKFRGRKFRKRSFRRRSYRRGNRSGRRANRIVSIKRTQLYQYYRNSGAPYLIQGAQSFKLSDLPNYGEFQVLFQYYRIKWIKLEFVPNMSPEIQYATAVNGPTSSWGATDILYAKRHADSNQRTLTNYYRFRVLKDARYPRDLLHG